jgi:quercetin dioxygenase-like cupin family protein
MSWFNPNYDAVLRADEGSAAIFRRGRVHAVTALEDKTVVMTILPAQPIG